ISLEIFLHHLLDFIPLDSILLILGTKKPVAFHRFKGVYRLKKDGQGLSFQQVQQVSRGRV
ncbi:hypothetical protein, partial [uncultured Oscillibacter sp.]|uniref:hypothetical protein n=1 Tax=uncultured Oscillibacter sp. TaxID=876091 RepID=UPI002729505A